MDRSKLPSTIHQAFASQAAATPQAIALVDGTESWSYQELDQRANAVAHEIAKFGICPNDRIALLLNRSAEAIAAILGILKSGAAYLPLSFADPLARRASLIESANPRLILTARTKGFRSAVPAVFIDDITGLHLAAPETAAGNNHLCYVMCSSGSTGEPKAVMVEHRSVIRLVKNADYATFGPQHTFLHFAPLAFDASTFEIWGALLNGGKLVILREGVQSLAEIGLAIQNNGVTTAWLTSGLFSAMVDQQLESLTRLQQLLTGGDIVSPRHARKFLDAAPHARLINGYGPTETTTFACCYTVPAGHDANIALPIGTPIHATSIYLLREDGTQAKTGETGEICIGGAGLARGYLGQPNLTAEKFVPNPFSTDPADRLYRTGDLGLQREDGVYEFLGRNDTQVKLRGFRIELGEIERALSQQPGVREAAVVTVERGEGEKTLVAFIVGCVDVPALAHQLPAYMIPARFVRVEALPLTANGKVDRKALTQALVQLIDQPAAGNALEQIIADVWSDILAAPISDLDRPFLELGISSLQLMRAHAELEKRLSRAIPITDLFQFPSVRLLAAQLKGTVPVNGSPDQESIGNDGIAIVGMAGRFPGARSVKEFWSNLLNGVESITFFKADELEAPATSGAIAAKPILENAEMFDAGYFGILPKEADVIDPQQRVFLECAVEALEDAGCDPARHNGQIGVFAGSSPNTYFLHHVCAQPDFLDSYTAEFQVGNYSTMLGTSADFLATRVAHKLDLKGPAINVATACSTSLVAVVQACESLRSGSCNAALAGGVSITYPQRRAYQYQEGGIVSPDGHCRPFDANAQGTVFGSGCGVVFLKRLADAEASGDHIYAVIKGWGINNDGAAKAGFTAPSVKGQAAAIRRAHNMAGFSPSSISYVETHGTATPLGDPIEIAALTQAFGDTSRKQYCGIGAAKSNVGHLDAASGITGLIKTALAVKNGVIPATIHFTAPNPRIDFSNSPFFVVDRQQSWNSEDYPRRAGVSAFGVGGTNAHVVLEQSVQDTAHAEISGPQLLLLSAKTPAALEKIAWNLADHLEAHSTPLCDVALTLAKGRSSWTHRKAVTAGTAKEAIPLLRQSSVASPVKRSAARLVFAFPGQGAQRAGMGSGLYQSFEVFRKAFDACADCFHPHLPADLRETLFKGDEDAVNQTMWAQPALFATSYALAELWGSWGVTPQAMVGHSVGEFVAACQAGVMTLEQACEVIALRGKWMQQQPSGAMLAVQMKRNELAALMPAGLALAAVNSPNACVVSGQTDLINSFEAALEAQEIAVRRLRTSHAFHSPMMNAAADALRAHMHGMKLAAPSVPFVSTLSGQWITSEQATSADYWARQCAEPVHFASALRTLQSEGPFILLETGVGRTLASLAAQNGGESNGITAISSLGLSDEVRALLQAVGTLWTKGIEPSWDTLFANTSARRVSLPTYPFERQRFVIERPAAPPPAISQSPQEPIMDHRPLAPASPLLNTPPEAIRSQLTQLFQDLSGLPLPADAAGVSFLDLGFDSLFLTQAAQKINTRYKTKIRFAQLLGELGSFEALSAYVAKHAPELAVTGSTVPAGSQRVMSEPVAPQPIATQTTQTDQLSIEQLLEEQVRIFRQRAAQQLAALHGAPLPPPAPSIATPAKSQEAFGPFKPIQRNAAATELTSQQQEYLAKFTARYSHRTRQSKTLAQQHRAALADPRVVSGFRTQWKEIVYPLTIVRSSGAKLWDTDGNEYIDILNGFGSTMFGHSPLFVREAIEEQLERGWEIGPQTPLAGKTAELLCELTGNERATFCNTGSEAVMAAMRLARTVTGRDKIVYFAGDYHGGFDEVLMKQAGTSIRPIAPGIPQESASNIIVLPYGAKESLDAIRRQAGDLAAVLVEPVQSRHPGLQPKEFLQELRCITEDAGTALIFDEVVTGFRTHIGGAQALFDVRADLVTYGKVIGGGLPLGVLAGKTAFMDALDGGAWQFGDDSAPQTGMTFLAGTFVRHPLAMAALWAVLNHLKSAGPALQQQITDKTTRLVDGINQLFAAASLAVRAENFHSIFYFAFPGDQRFAPVFYHHLRVNGVHILEGFPCFLTTAHSDADVERIIAAFATSLREMQDGGLLPNSKPLPSEFAPFECPLTEAQMEIRLSAQLGDEESCAFNEGFSVEFEGSLNRTALASAIAQVIRRHESLRATLHVNGDRLLIHPRMSVALPVVNLTKLVDAEQQQQIAELKEREAWQPFDLANGPLIRMHLVKRSEHLHVLLVTAHHLICDGWSTGIILDEVSKLYSAACQGATAVLPEALSFGDYARMIDGQVDPKIEQFWISQFASPVSALELPLDRPRPEFKSYRGATYTTELSPEWCTRVRRYGSKQGATMFVTLLAGFDALLAKLSGQPDIVIGVPSAGQANTGELPLVGHCVNFLPIRIAVDQDADFAVRVAKTRDQLLAAQEHSEYTYGTLVRKLALPRSVNRLPLIEVQFNLERTGSGLDFNGLKAKMEQSPKRFVNFDLFLNLVEGPNGIRVYCDYNSDLFDELTIATWMRKFEALIESAVSTGTAEQGVPLSTAASSWAAGEAVTNPKVCAHALFELKAASSPDSIAVRFGSGALTYDALNRRANQLAHWLRSRGVRAGALIGISLEPSVDMLVAVLGVLKSGAAYLPLDPSYPQERLAYIRQDAEALLVLEEGRLPDVTQQPDHNLPAVDMRELAYVIYTSGSTGKPKGVEIEHTSLTNFLLTMQKTPGIAAHDRLLAVTTLSFDISGLELLLPLISGAEVVIASRDNVRDGAALAGLIARYGITVMQATPTTWKMLLETGWQGSADLKILCGGEELTRDLASQLIPRCASLWNMYGPTETTIWSSTVQITNTAGITIGAPIANTQFYVLDDLGNSVPQGAAGELYIGGDGLARGYRNRPQLTGERFARKAVNTNLRLYRTGDAARANMDGTFTYMGRLDRQVKLRGHRIELGEIEETLLVQGCVRDAAVIIREDAPGDKRLVAYVVATADGAALCSENNLRSELAGRLPGYMVPSRFVILDALPLTANGKLDRLALNALPAPAANAQELAGKRAPLDNNEIVLAVIIGETLGTSRVGLDDDFFALGGDSIHLYQVAARAQRAGIEITPKQLLQHRTIARVLEASKTDSQISRITARPRDNFRARKNN